MSVAARGSVVTINRVSQSPRNQLANSCSLYLAIYMYIQTIQLLYMYCTCTCTSTYKHYISNKMHKSPIIICGGVTFIRCTHLNFIYRFIEIYGWSINDNFFYMDIEYEYTLKKYVLCWLLNSLAHCMYCSICVPGVDVEWSGRYGWILAFEVWVYNADGAFTDKLNSRLGFLIAWVIA